MQVFFYGRRVLDWSGNKLDYSKKRTLEILQELKAKRGDFVVAVDGVYGVLDEWGDGELCLACLVVEDVDSAWRKVILKEYFLRDDDNNFSACTIEEGLGHSRSIEFEMRNAYSTDIEKTGNYRIIP